MPHEGDQRHNPPPAGLPPGAVTARGWLAERIDRGYAAVCNLRGSLWWHGSMWGYEHVARWLRNVVLYGRYCGRHHPAVPEVVEALLALVENGTAFRDYAANWLAAYNEEEFLMGLLAYHAAFPDRRVLDAAIRLGRSLAENHPRLQANHYYKGLAIGRLLDLARAAGDPRFREAAIAIAEDQRLALLNLPGAPDAVATHGAAAAMILCWYVDLHAATGQPQYLDWALGIWRAIRDRMFITGGLGECLFFRAPPSESDLHDETCQHAWWLIANLRLARATGDPQYMDLVERTLYNHLLFAQLHRGEDAGFCALGDIDQGFRGQHNYICCDNEGFYSLLHLVSRVFSVQPDDRQVSLDLLVPAEAELGFADGPAFRVRVDTDYPVRGEARLALETAEPSRFSLRVRIPGGGAPTGVRVNGEDVTFRFDGGYVVLHRLWHNRDTVNVVFPIAARVEADNTGRGAKSAPVTIDGRTVEAKRIGVFHGPVLAALFRTGHGNDLSWVWTGDYPEVLDSGGCPFEGFPASKSDYLEGDGAVCHTGGPAAGTEVLAARRAPLIRWTQAIGDRVKLTQEVTVLPGLPVTLDWRETIEGDRGPGRLLCSGLRFAVAKRTQNPRYGAVAFPYPFPAVTTRDDLSLSQGFVAGGGSFSLAERLADGGELPKTGTFRLSNGYFRAICHYDPASVEKVVSRATADWAGVYMVPAAGERTVLQRRLIFPLHDRPLSQDLTKAEIRQAAAVSCSVGPTAGGALTVTLGGPTVEDAPIFIPKASGLKAGWLLYNTQVAAPLLDYDADRLVVRVPAPGEFKVERTAGFLGHRAADP